MDFREAKNESKKLFHDNLYHICELINKNYEYWFFNIIIAFSTISNNDAVSPNFNVLRIVVILLPHCVLVRNNGIRFCIKAQKMLMMK